MKTIISLLSDNIFDGFGTAEWIYIGVGIVALITMVVTIVYALKNKKSIEEHTAVAEPVVEVKAEPVVEVKPEPIVESKPKSIVEAKPQSAVEKPIAVVADPTLVATVAKLIEQKPKEDDHFDVVIKRGKIQIRYIRSLTAKIMQADDVVKAYYDILKNELLSYKGVKSRLSWKHESFHKGRALVAKIKLRGNNLRLLLPLNPSDYVDTKYKVDDMSDKKSHADTPCSYSIKNDRRSRYAKDLIATVMQNIGVNKVEKEYVKYSDEFPYDTTEHLIYRKLIKLVLSKVVEDGDGESEHYEPISGITAEEVMALMSDEEAKESVEESARVSDKTKTGIVNVDVLSKLFVAGETVTLDEIKKRVAGFNKKTTYVKVLARGVIDKPLIVEADDYSIDAVKMILLSGGKVIRTKKSNG